MGTGGGVVTLSDYSYQGVLTKLTTGHWPSENYYDATDDLFGIDGSEPGTVLSSILGPGILTCGLSALGSTGAAADSATGRLLWTSWQNYPKVTVNGREYAQIGGRLYSDHAVARMQPRGLGAPAGTVGAGRSVSPNFVEDVIRVAAPDAIKGPRGESRLSYVYGTVQVITEEDGTVVSIITR